MPKVRCYDPREGATRVMRPTQRFTKTLSVLVKELGLKETLQLCRGLFMSKSRGLVFLYLCLNGEATAQGLEARLGMNDGTIYRVLGELRDLGLVVEEGKVQEKPGKTRRLWRPKWRPSEG
jgi:predicted transcriptional regulator